MRLLVGAAVRDYQSSSPFPFAELHKGIYVKDDNQAVQVVLARTSPSGAVELDVRIRPKPGLLIQPAIGGSDNGRCTEA